MLTESETAINSEYVQDFHRAFLKMAGLGVSNGATTLLRSPVPRAQTAGSVSNGERSLRFDVRHFGAKGAGTTIDSLAINAAIDAAANVGEGTVAFPAGVYASYSIHPTAHGLMKRRRLPRRFLST